MTKITLNTADLSDADIQAALDMLPHDWAEVSPRVVRNAYPTILAFAAALRLIRKERAEHEARNRKVSDAMKVLHATFAKVPTVGNYLGTVTFSDFILPDPVDPIEERAREAYARELDKRGWNNNAKAVRANSYGKDSKASAAIAVIADAMRGEGK